MADSPDLLTGVPLATVDEFWIPGIGSVDIVGVGPDGSITIVECKLRANPEIRREVVGQVLAYAGGLWKMSYDDFAAGWAARSHGKGTLAEMVAAASAQEIVDDELRLAVSACLAAGTFSLIIAVDEITEELKRVVEYLNIATRADVTVLAMELQYLKDGPLEILIPRTYGQSLGEAKRSASTTGVKWDLESFGREVEKLSDADRSVIGRLLEHGKTYGDHPWFGEAQTPGMSYYYRVNGQRVSLFQIYLKSTGPTVAVSVGGVASAKTLGPQRALEFLSGLRAIPEIAPSVAHLNADNLNRYPPIPITQLEGPGVIEKFLSVIDSVRLSAVG
ncbi:MAG TPA: hypothetical protein VK662_14255 [Acidothermaceae bacterium]|nr:hypothetical protein [Acidothermaceae bacterium]